MLGLSYFYTFLLYFSLWTCKVLELNFMTKSYMGIETKHSRHLNCSERASLYEMELKQWAWTSTTTINKTALCSVLGRWWWKHRQCDCGTVVAIYCTWANTLGFISVTLGLSGCNFKHYIKWCNLMIKMFSLLIFHLLPLFGEIKVDLLVFAYVHFILNEQSPVFSHSFFPSCPIQ